MKSDPLGPAASQSATIYLIVGLAALGLIGFGPLRSGDYRAALGPILIGTGGLLFLGRMAPLGVLAALAAGLVLTSRRSAPLTNDILLGLGVVVYLIAQYRLFALRAGAVPGEEDGEPRVRTDADVPARELSAVLLTAAASVIAAVMFWEMTALIRPRWRLSAANWRLQVLVWILGFVLLVVAGAIAYWAARRQSTDEALLALRDEFWRETRGEQRKINRWLAWARRRRERAGEPFVD